MGHMGHEGYGYLVAALTSLEDRVLCVPMCHLCQNPGHGHGQAQDKNDALRAAIPTHLSAVCTNRGPKNEPPMPMATTFFKGLPA